MGLLFSRPANSKVPHRTGTTVYEYQEVMQNPWHLRTLGYFRDIVHWNFFELLSRFWVNTCTENSHRGRNPVLKSWFWPHVFSLFTAISLNKQLQPLIRWLRWECRNMVWNLDLDRALQLQLAAAININRDGGERIRERWLFKIWKSPRLRHTYCILLRLSI